MRALYTKLVLFSLCCAGIFLLTGIAFAQKKIDEFGYSNAEEAMARLDNFFIELQNSPASLGYIIVYGPRSPKRGELNAHIKQIPDYIKFRRMASDRIKIVNGGYRDNATVTLTFWVVPEGVKAPEASDNLDTKLVKFQKGVFRRKSLYFCC